MCDVMTNFGKLVKLTSTYALTFGSHKVFCPHVSQPDVKQSAPKRDNMLVDEQTRVVAIFTLPPPHLLLGKSNVVSGSQSCTVVCVFIVS